MTEDKALWRKALTHYRAWNEAEFADRVRRAGEHTPIEKWNIFLDLWSFGIRIRPEQGRAGLCRETEGHQVYYTRIQQFEEKRRQRECS